MKLKFLVVGKPDIMTEYIERLQKEKHLHVIKDWCIRIERWALYEEEGSDLRPVIDLAKIPDIDIRDYEHGLLLDSMEKTQGQIRNTIDKINNKFGIT